MIKLASVFQDGGQLTGPFRPLSVQCSHEMNLMAYLSVKMKDEPMSDQQPLASSHTLWSKHIFLARPQYRRCRPGLFTDSIPTRKHGERMREQQGPGIILSTEKEPRHHNEWCVYTWGICPEQTGRNVVAATKAATGAGR